MFSNDGIAYIPPRKDGMEVVIESAVRNGVDAASVLDVASKADLLAAAEVIRRQMTLAGRFDGVMSEIPDYQVPAAMSADPDVVDLGSTIDNAHRIVRHGSGAMDWDVFVNVQLLRLDKYYKGHLAVLPNV